MLGYEDDSAEIQASNDEVPTVNLVVPVRHTNAHNVILNRRDFEQLMELVVSMLKKLDATGLADSGFWGGGEVSEDL